MTESSKPASPYSFIACIDESGDEGFTFKDPPLRASSEWFGLGAIIIRESDRLETMRHMGDAIAPIEKNRKGKRVHFSQIPHEARVHICDALGRSKCVAVYALVNKRTLANDGKAHSLDDTGSRRLYFYLSRFLVERISWYVRDSTATGPKTCRMVFSKSESISYANMTAYFSKLESDRSCQIHWPSLDNKVSVVSHNESLGCRLADASISGMCAALELNPYGHCETAYMERLKPLIYQRGGNYLSYGMKFFPGVPAVDAHGRYKWLSAFQKK